MEKKCLYCGKKFKTKYVRQIYCSHECFKRKAYESQSGIEYKKEFIIFTRDNFTCVYCGKNVFEDYVKLEVDHLIPRTAGGTDNDDNLVTSCFDCNRSKGGKLLSEKIISKIKRKIRRKTLKGGKNGKAL